MAEVEHNHRTVVSAMFNQLAPLAAEENEPSPASSGGPGGSPTVGGGEGGLELEAAAAAAAEANVVGVPQSERNKGAWDSGIGAGNATRPEEDDDALSAVAEEETVAESAMPATKLSNLPKVVSAVETGKSAESPEGKQGGERSAEAESIMKVTISTSSSSAPPPLFPPDGEQETATPSVSSSSSMPSGSRMICLRALRPGGEGAGKAQAAATAAAEAAAAAVAKEMTVGAGKPSTGALVGAVVSNKVVDLREVKKVRPVVLTPITVATEASVASSSDDEAGGGGSVKVDLSAGKRMIEFQLKVNAAEEKREAARLKSERDRADAAIAEASQNALAHVNARIEAQRRGRGGGSSGSGMSSSSSSSFGGGNGARAVAEAQIRVLAERHGIRVHILDEEHSSRVEQIRDLAREHGLQVQIVGEGAGEGGGGRQSDDSKLQEEFATGNRADMAAEMAESGAGAGAEETAEGKPGSGGTSTPPPVLSSLRPRSKTRTISPSSAPRMLSKAPAKENAGGKFTGPARMMRMALNASSICKAGDKEINTVAYRETDAGSRENESRRASTGGLTAKRPKLAWATGGGDAKTMSTIKPASDHQASATSDLAAVTSDSLRTSGSNDSELGSASADVSSDSGEPADGETAAGAKRKSGERVVVQDNDKSNEKNSTSSGNGAGRRSASVVKRVGAEAGTGAVEFASSPAVSATKAKTERSDSLPLVRDAILKRTRFLSPNGSPVVKTRTGEAASATKANPERSNSLPTVRDATRKRTHLLSPNGSPAVKTRTGETASATKANPERSDYLPTVRDATRKRTHLLSPSGVVSRSEPAPSASNVSAKKIRLMDPRGVMSEPNTPIANAARPGRRGAGNGGAGWQAGNNNLFKGAMAGIMARGKRPDS